MVIRGEATTPKLGVPFSWWYESCFSRTHLESPGPEWGELCGVSVWQGGGVWFSKLTGQKRPHDHSITYRSMLLLHGFSHCWFMLRSFGRQTAHSDSPTWVRGWRCSKDPNRGVPLLWTSRPRLGFSLHEAGDYLNDAAFDHDAWIAP